MYGAEITTFKCQSSKQNNNLHKDKEGQVFTFEVEKLTRFEILRKFP
eukprot:UN07857